MTKKVAAFQCDFCSKYGKNQTRIRKHEETCFYRPETHSCGSCGHLSDWSCRMGVAFTQEEGRRTPRLKTGCPLYASQDLIFYGQEKATFYN